MTEQLKSDQLRFSDTGGDPSYLEEAMKLFPSSELATYEKIVDEILAGLEEDAGTTNEASSIKSISESFDPVEVAVTCRQFGIGRHDSWRVKRRTAQRLKVFRVMTDNQPSGLMEEDVVSLVLGGLGAEVTLMDPSGHISTKPLNERKRRFNRIPDDSPIDHLRTKPNQYDLIHLVSETAEGSYLHPDPADQNQNALTHDIALSKIQTLLAALKPDGIVLLSKKDREVLRSLFDSMEADEAEAVLNNWRQQGVLLRAYPSYGLKYESTSVIEHPEPPVLIIEKGPSFEQTVRGELNQLYEEQHTTTLQEGLRSMREMRLVRQAEIAEKMAEVAVDFAAVLTKHKVTPGVKLGANGPMVWVITSAFTITSPKDGSGMETRHYKGLGVDQTGKIWNYAYAGPGKVIKAKMRPSTTGLSSPLSAPINDHIRHGSVENKGLATADDILPVESINPAQMAEITQQPPLLDWYRHLRNVAVHLIDQSN